MMALHIITVVEEISSEALKEYARLFNHSLNQDQVEALSALFGWALPDNLKY